jgi:hypothetical protein
MFSAPHASLLRQDLESLGFRDFHVVLYVRDPADYFLSFMQQFLKASDPQPFIKDPVSWRYRFRRITEMWEQVFPDRLIVRKFPSDTHEDVVEDFASLLMQHLGVTLPRVTLRENTSLSAEGMQILQDYRETFWPDNGGRITPDTARLVRFLAEQAHGIPQTKPTLKPELAELIRANHKADAEILYASYGVDLGLQNCSATAAQPRETPYGVSEIVESLDPEIVRKLLLRLARTELGLSSLLAGVATRAYRAIPPAHRPKRLADWLRPHL